MPPLITVQNVSRIFTSGAKTVMRSKMFRLKSKQAILSPSSVRAVAAKAHCSKSFQGCFPLPPEAFP